MRRVAVVAALMWTLAVVLVVGCGLARAAAPNFNTALYKVVLPVEGGYVFNPKDTGGETYKGISRNNFPKWRGWAAVDQIKKTVPPMPKFGTAAYYAWAKGLNRLLKASPTVSAAVEGFYRQYWVLWHMGECRYDGMAYFWADTLTNNGPIANRWLKKAINRTAHKTVVNDKTITITSDTIKELNKLPQDRVLFWFATSRASKYDAIADRNGEFTDSWADRFIAQIISMVKGRAQ